MENSFGAFLKEKRKEKNLTQKELAKLLNVSESTVSKWETNVAHPDITLLSRLSEILGVSERELITASIDKRARAEKAQAKKWRAFLLSWNLFFYVSYGVAVLVCFICNLAIDKTLSWFWIVLSALILAFSITTLPQFIKKYKLIFIPLSIFLALSLLLGVCCIYNKGDWFWIAIFSIVLGAIIIFTPIYISKYKVFTKIRKYNDFASFAIYFIFLNILLLIIDGYSISNNYASNHWYFSIAFPITLMVYLILNLFLSVRFLKINRLLKTSLILFLVTIFIYIIPLFVKLDNASLQKEIEDLNFLKANFSNWGIEMIERNVHCIIFMALSLLTVIFLLVGMIVHYTKKKE